MVSVLPVQNSYPINPYIDRSKVIVASFIGALYSVTPFRGNVSFEDTLCIYAVHGILGVVARETGGTCGKHDGGSFRPALFNFLKARLDLRYEFGLSVSDKTVCNQNVTIVTDCLVHGADKFVKCYAQHVIASCGAYGERSKFIYTGDIIGINNEIAFYFLLFCEQQPDFFLTVLPTGQFNLLLDFVNGPSRTTEREHPGKQSLIAVKDTAKVGRDAFLRYAEIDGADQASDVPKPEPCDYADNHQHGRMCHGRGVVILHRIASPSSHNFTDSAFQAGGHASRTAGRVA